MIDRSLLMERMAALKDGDRSAFGPVFEALLPLVRAIARRSIDGADVDDAAQQALLKLFSQAHRYEVGRDVVPWAISIAAWECRTLARRRLRERSRRGDVDAAEMAGDAGDPESVLVSRAALAAAEDALSALSDDDRAALARALDEHPLSARERKQKQRALTRWKSHLDALLGRRPEEHRG